MSDKKRLIGLGTITFVLGVIVMFPARIAYHAFAPDEFRLSSIDGSVWNGSAAEGQVSNLYLRNARWSFKPLSLLTAKIAFDTSFDPAGGFMDLSVAFGIGGSITLTDVEGAVTIGALQSVVQTPGIDGNVRLSFSNLKIEDGVPVQADGTIEVTGLVARGLSAMPIGDFQAQLQTADSGVTGSVEDTGGMLDIAGALQVSADRTYSLTGLVAPTASTPRAVVEQLKFLGSANERGQREFRFEGQL